MTPRRVSETELHAFVDGELTPQERAEIETLLQASPSDQALVRELTELNEALRARYSDRLDATSAAVRAAADCPGAATAIGLRRASSARWRPAC